MDPYRLGLSVQAASGDVTKWGPDSPDGRDVPQDLEFTTSIPGGHKTLQCSLLREFNRSNPDNNLFDRVRCYGPGNETAFDGFFTRFPKQQSSTFSVEPGAVGWSALLEFDTGLQMVYVDRDMGQWQDASTNRKLQGASSWGGFGWTRGNLGVVCALPNTAQPAQAISELWYMAPPGIQIASYQYIGREANPPVGWEAPGVFSGSDDITIDARAAATFDNTLRSVTPANTTRRFGMWRVWAAGAVATPAAGANRAITAIAVYGNHGLTLRTIDVAPGAGSSGTPQGLYGSDVVADIVQRTGQGILTYTTGPGGSIEPNTIIIPHLVFREPTSGSAAIGTVSAFGITPLVIPEWGVYGKQFFWRSPNPDRLCWQARLSDGTKPLLEGDQADDRFNGVLVTFTDPYGIQRVAGPPAAYWYGGTALADSTDPTLVDTSSTNPINAQGIPRKWAKLQLSNPTTTAGAIALGAVFLQVQSQPQRRGQIELQGLVRHPTISQSRPVWKIQAGDYIQIPDSNEKDIKRRVIGTRYSHATRTCVADVDATPFTLDALLTLMAADLVGVLS